MKRKVLMSIALILALLIVVLGLFFGSIESPLKEGFSLIFLENNVMLISDVDVLSYNVTS